MSAILNALKKLENVAPPEDGVNALRSRIARSGNRSGSGRGRRWPWVAWGLGAVLLGASVSLSLRWFPLTGAPLPAPGSDSAQGEAAGAVEKPVAASPEEPPADDADRSKPPVDPRNLPAGLASLAVAPAPAVPGDAQARFPAPGSPTQEEPVRPRTPGFQARPLEHLPRAAIPDLRLEGIVWSDSPESRFAVINGQIVKQGGTVRGFLVTRIEEDHVLVRSRDGTGERRLTVR